MEKNEKKPLIELISGISSMVVAIGLIVATFLINYFSKRDFVSIDGSKFEPAWYIYLLYVVGSLIVLVGAYLIYAYVMTKKEVKRMSVKQMTLIGTLSAISIVLYYFAKFPLPFFPPWLDIQFSDLPALIGSFIYGPWAGILIVFIRFVVKLPGTSTVGVGELADLILGVVLVVTSGLIYKKHRTIKGAFIGSLIGVGAATVAACFTNWLLLIPAYIKIAGFPLGAIVGSLSYIKVGGESVVTADNYMLYYIFVGVVPFNLFRYSLVLALTFILYKRISWLFNKIG